MPVFLSLIAHPAFKTQSFLKNHTMPAMQISKKLTKYLNAEGKLGRVRQDNVAEVARILLSHLHNLLLSENIGTHQFTGTNRAVNETIAALWHGLKP